jgi:hypothetical protein
VRTESLGAHPEDPIPLFEGFTSSPTSSTSPASSTPRTACLGRVIQVLREAGFSIELAYSAFLTLDSYIYGFVLQEVWSPLQVEDRPELIENLRPAIAPSEYPYIVEMMTFLMSRSRESARGSGSIAASYATDFEFGLDLVLDGLERAFGARRES